MPQSQSASIRVRDLAKRYGPVEALRGISFDVAEGEIFGLLGPNGAGKTTAIECMLGLRRPDAGAIVIGGVDAVAFPDRTKVFVGAQIQASGLQDKLTPRQALVLLASFYGDAAEPGDLLDRFGLREKADAAFDTLSQGQKQRLLVALAFVNRPRVVFLDEPTAGLDPHARRDVHRIIAELRSPGHTVVLSTQNLEEAHRLCDRLAILDHGRVVATGTPDALIEQAGGRAHLAVATALPMDASAARSLAGVVEAQPRDRGWWLATTDLNRTVVDLVKTVEREGNTLLDLQIQRASLEDAFIALTGRAWPGGEGQEGSP